MFEIHDACITKSTVCNLCQNNTGIRQLSTLAPLVWLHCAHSSSVCFRHLLQNLLFFFSFFEKLREIDMRQVILASFDAMYSYYKSQVIVLEFPLSFLIEILRKSDQVVLNLSVQ